ncbi:D-alanyl-D-alanine carboxypeptidase [Amphiplicatus metriothermophilus]|uniref:D-alanyl-D-alanine carboxypeptidase n=1 Tax=Amphiplicatus metriothermophilus TaxID=1519374 RepID=A0A239PPA4_9PROT|nr:D-alanyl-D-alanine carboxypeptidase [Amphiplicatus metriothermophilus]MBB5518889.1 D-alanyl-D-alanine carboxypeptidase [Amphiplicatus metriothermophilus]SNT71958.1 D-alanyl-D-alanine carboxypeptidase [Amphiplicatus metriothermophilus]
MTLVSRLSFLAWACATAFLLACIPAAANPKYAAIVVHADSGDVLFDRYSTEARYPASLTKMMTLYLLFEEMEAGRLSPNSKLKVSAQAAGQPPSKLGLTAGETIDVDTAVKALVVKSANDVAVVVAEAIAGSEWRFAQKMTEKARALGMRGTTFRNASGLPNSKQRTTARDMAVLGKRLVQDFPQYYHYFSTENFEWSGRTYRTHNALVKTYPGADGLKTGYTRMSGFNLATSATRDGNRLIGIVLGGRSVRTRDAHMREILDDAFGRLKKNPTLIASLHRNTPSPRLKPSLLAHAASQKTIPTVAGSDAMREEVALAATRLGGEAPAAAEAGDVIGSLIASAAVEDDLNEYERTRLASLSAPQIWSEGDAEASFAGEPVWHVQIGAYSTKEMAQLELEKAAREAGLVARPRAVQPTVTAAGDYLYRARFVTLNAEEASETCKALKARRIACFILADAASAG